MELRARKNKEMSGKGDIWEVVDGEDVIAIFYFEGEKRAKQYANLCNKGFSFHGPSFHVGNKHFNDNPDEDDYRQRFSI